ncbi:O-antigen ligase family protein [Lutimonas zeaxanthinifaciens]|uniref:O-antigen ligase family protein n=1 Tax=Lutimonas zeaxanthinifaciens TaxID=3060215 RepID=UPI00265C930B|nr:O-antigen ligase family protein [Lutimonas sp. YSD2104]WKK66708.1 O-antigen ligase family protein [Lutimonas sp. YSD2104]
MPIVFVYSRKSHQALALKVLVYFLSTFSILLLGAGLFRAWFNKGEVVYGNWDSQTTEEFYAQEMFLNWGELSYKRLFLFIDMHPSYYAFFSATVLMILLFTNLIKIRQWRYFALLILHPTMILLISSKAGIISLVVIIGALFFKQKNLKSVAFGILAIIFLGAISINIPSTRVRFEKVYNEIVSNRVQKEMGNNKGRLVLWNTLKDYSKLELVTGIGTKKARNRVLELTGEDKNMHNQFLQELVSAGLLGLILLICFLALPLIYSKHFFTYIFIPILVIFLLLENMMDRIWGIMLISFFYSLFVFGDQNLLKKRNNSSNRLV